MLIKSRCVVLHVLKYTEDTVIVDTFTENLGKVSFIVKLSRSKHALVKPGFLQPLSILEAEWNHGRAALTRFKTVRVWKQVVNIPTDPYKAAIAMFISEFLNHTLREEHDSELLFEYLVRSVEWLDTCMGGFANFHIVFLLRLTRFLGFHPNLRDFREGCYFDMLNSCFTDKQPLHGHYLAPKDAALLPLLMRMQFATMHIFKFSGQERNSLLRHINNYYRLHIPNFPELKSLDVLRELFS